MKHNGRLGINEWASLSLCQAVSQQNAFFSNLTVVCWNGNVVSFFTIVKHSFWMYPCSHWYLNSINYLNCAQEDVAMPYISLFPIHKSVHGRRCHLHIDESLIGVNDRDGSSEIKVSIHNGQSYSSIRSFNRRKGQMRVSIDLIHLNLEGTLGHKTGHMAQSVEHGLLVEFAGLWIHNDGSIHKISSPIRTTL